MVGPVKDFILVGKMIVREQEIMEEGVYISDEEDSNDIEIFSQMSLIDENEQIG